tara:strand:+ start:3502 stop:3693 length:192 start_codon:yes stop_codon:yes gene_type:complete
VVYSKATHKKSNEIWANLNHFLGNRKSQDEFFKSFVHKKTKPTLKKIKDGKKIAMKKKISLIN